MLQEPRPDPWDEYRRRIRKVQRGLWLGLWLALPAAAAGLVAAWLWTPGAAAVPALLWTIFMAVAATFAESTPCPRCREPFARKGLFHNSFTKKCLHCHLDKWSIADLK